MKIIKIKENKKRRLTIRGILSILVAAVAVRSFLAGNYENLFTCILTLLLFCVPLYIDRRLRIDLPPTLEAIIYLFIFAADSGRNRLVLHQIPRLGHHAAHDQRLPDGGDWLRAG